MKNNKGFSLVELIVVIAIMAILAAVAVIGVSVYIPKAQQANDKQLVSDIVYAIKLRDYETQFASNNNGVVGYVVVTEDGVKASGEEVIAALKALYGENYETSSDLKLAYDGWTDTIVMLQQVGADDIKDYIGSVNESTFFNDIGTDKILVDVQHCATSFGQFLKNQYKDNPKGATNAMIGGFTNNSQAVKDLLKDAGYANEEDYANVSPEVLQNVTVFGVASAVKSDKTAVIDNFTRKEFLGDGFNASSLDGIATWYAAAEALVAYLNDEECTEAFSEIDLTGSAQDIVVNMGNAYSTIFDEVTKDGEESDLYKHYMSYYDESDNKKSQARKDGESFVAIMSSVNNLSGDYITNQEAVQNSNLFADGAMNNRVDTYIAAANLADEIKTDPELNNLLTNEESAVVVIACATNGVLDILLLPAGVQN